MVLPDKVYDVLKWVTLLVIPALGTLYFALAGFWGFPYASEIEGTCLAIATFFGTILKISDSAYKKKR